MYNFGNETLSITGMLKNPEVLNFLERNRNYTPASRRDKLRKLLNEHKDNLREMVDEYNLQNPPMQEHRREAEKFMPYGAQKQRANLRRREPRRRRIEINGENLTAKQAFKKYPQLRGYYHIGSKKLLRESTLHAKLRKDFKNNKIPNEILNENPPEFRQATNHFNGAHVKFTIDDERIRFHDFPSVFTYLESQILNLIRTHRKTKVSMSIHAWMLKRSSEKLMEIKKRLYTDVVFENYLETDQKSIFDAMREVIFEQLQKLEDVEGSGWVLTSIDSVSVSFFEITDLVGGSGYRSLPKELSEKRKNRIVNVDNRNDMKDQCFPIALRDI